MDFRFTKEQEALRQKVETFCRQHCTEEQAEALDRQPRFPIELHKALAESGLLGYCLPKEHGGSGGGTVELCIINEGLGRHSNAAMNLLFINGISGAMIGLAGTEVQKQQYLRAIAEGRMRFAFALTEPGAGSDAASITSSAIRNGDDYVINGVKLYTTGAGDADFILTVVRTSTEGKASKATSLLVVPTSSAGLTITPLDKIACSGVASCRVEYRDVRIPITHRLDAENQGWGVLMLGGGLERLSVAACSLGIAQAIFDEVKTYLSIREQYGQSVSKFQAIQHQLADMATEIEAMRLLTYSAAWMTAQGMMPVKEVSMAKLYCSERVNEIAQRGMRLMGGMAYFHGTPIQRRMRESLLSFYAGGTMEVQRNLIARNLGL